MPLSLTKAVERYRTLGFAIEAAIDADQWDEVSSLLDERDKLLKQFAGGSPRIDDRSKAELQVCDQRLIGFLTGTQAQNALGLRALQEGSQLRRAYRPSSTPSATFEKAG